MKTFSKLALAAFAVALVGTAPAAARTGPVFAPPTQIECPGGHVICKKEGGKLVCTCGGPVT